MSPQTSSSPQPLKWLTLGEAARLLGVHPTTLRRWADEGEIRFLRTPGGHRRFLEGDLDVFLESQTESVHQPAPYSTTRSLVRQTRRELESERVRETRWHRAFGKSERTARRASGRRLVGLAIQFASRRTGRETILAQARDMGREYGEDAAERGLSLVDTTRAFLFFREALIRSARPGMTTRGQYDAEDVHIHRSLREFLDEVLFAALDAYESRVARPLSPPKGSS